MFQRYSIYLTHKFNSSLFLQKPTDHTESPAAHQAQLAGNSFQELRPEVMTFSISSHPLVHRHNGLHLMSRAMDHPYSGNVLIALSVARNDEPPSSTRTPT